MQFIKITETYAVNADRIVDVSYTQMTYGDEQTDGKGERADARVVIRIAGTTEVEEQTLEGSDAENFWSRITGISLR